MLRGIFARGEVDTYMQPYERRAIVILVLLRTILQWGCGSIFDRANRSSTLGYWRPQTGRTRLLQMTNLVCHRHYHDLLRHRAAHNNSNAKHTNKKHINTLHSSPDNSPQTFFPPTIRPGHFSPTLRPDQLSVAARGLPRSWAYAQKPIHRPINILSRCRTSYSQWIISCSHR